MDINRKTAFEVLLDVEKNSPYSNLALNRFIKKNSAPDPAFIRELVYGVLKNKYLLDYFLKNFVKKGYGKLRTEDLTLLRMGAYQILYMDSVPSYAAVSETVDLTKKYSRGKTGFINGVLRSLDRNRDSLEYPAEDDPAEYISIRYSVRKWIAEILTEAFGYEKAKAYMEASNSSPELSLRVNLLKNTPEELMRELEDEGFDVRRSGLSPRAVIAGGTGILESRAFREGRFSVQDQASVLAADLLGAESGMTVADICAAPGGKTAAIAEMMNNEGEIFAFDIYEHKLRLMDELMERNGIEIVKTSIGDGRVFNEDLEDKCDRVLCDVPCSGLGVIGRKPEIKYRDQYDLTELINTQKTILENASRYVKKGGALVYSTCTVNPHENREVTEAFLREHTGYVREREECPDPVDNGTDGFYITKIIREA